MMPKCGISQKLLWNTWTFNSGVICSFPLAFPGPDSQTIHPHLHSSVDRTALHLQRCQQGHQQHRLTVPQHGRHHVWSSHDHCDDL